MIWAELMERTGDFYAALSVGEDPEIPEPAVHNYSHELSTDAEAYKPVTDYWRAVDQRLGITYPPSGLAPTANHDVNNASDSK
jgi:hypothetical protein